MNRITLTDPAILFAAALHQSTEKTRYYLQGVYIEPYRDADGNGARIVATDGHRLSVGYDAGAIVADDIGDGHCPGVILPIDKSLFRHLTSRKAASVVWDGSTMTVRDANESPLGMAPCAAIDGTFPDVMRVIPEEIENTTAGICWNPSYLATYEKIAKAFAVAHGSRDPLPMRLGANGNGPAWVSIAGVDNWHGALMPCCDKSGGRSVLPEWVKRQQPVDRPENQPAAVA